MLGQNKKPHHISFNEKLTKNPKQNHLYQVFKKKGTVSFSEFYLLDWSDDGLGGRGSTENSSSLPCMASILVLARVKGAVGRAIPILTGIIRDSATLHNSSTAYGNNAWNTRLHFPIGCGIKLLGKKIQDKKRSNMSFFPINFMVIIFFFSKP